jgi:hypothetical protein
MFNVFSGFGENIRKCAQKEKREDSKMDAKMANGTKLDSPSAHAALPADVNMLSLEKDESHQKSKNHLALSAEETALKTQLEFYFSDSNLVNDKYLVNLLEQDTFNSPFNCVKLEDIVKFKKVNKLLDIVFKPSQVINSKHELLQKED